MLEIGSLVDGKYRVLRVVGKGGMSVVYQAVNEKANKIWAIKEVRKDGTQNFEVVKQNLVAEIDMLKKFNHPNLPSIIDVIDTEDSFLIVMDYIEGNSLSKALETSGAQSQDDVIEWSKQLCDVLGYLHSRKPPIIYRDMKPANVMLKPDGCVSLIDFGTAREFKSTSVEDTQCLGTQGYAAPEQYGGQGQTDARTDIYCLGATMYHLVTGHNPCLPPYEMYPIRQWNPMLSSGLEEIIIKCTQRNPNDRYQSCAELMYALEHFQDLDIENKKVQSFKWKTFLTSAIICLAMVFGALGFKIGANLATTSEYDKKIDYAASKVAENPDQAVEEYKKAIAIEPTRTDAYYSVLDIYMEDGKISQAELLEIDSIMTTVSAESGKTVNTGSALASSNREEYARLLKTIADDVFFCYGSTFESGIKSSTNWYNRAHANTGNDDLIAEIERYQLISSTYSETSGIDATGKMTGTDTREAFDSLVQIVDTVDPGENIVVSLRTYQFVSDLLLKKVPKFKQTIPLNEYTALLTTLEQKLNEVRSTEVYINNVDSNTVLRDAYDGAMNNIAAARQQGYGTSSGSTERKTGD